MKASNVFLALRQDGVPLVVVHVVSFDFFRLGITRVLSAPAAFRKLIGREFASLGQAAFEINRVVYGKGERGTLALAEYEAYCIGELNTEDIGTGMRRINFGRGDKRDIQFSPLLAATPVEIVTDDQSQRGRWIACGDLLPLVPPDTPDDVIEERMLREVHHD